MVLATLTCRGGDVIACEYMCLVCRYFLGDLKYGEARHVYFSEPRAQHIINFYKFVPHVKGDTLPVSQLS